MSIYSIGRTTGGVEVPGPHSENHRRERRSPQCCQVAVDSFSVKSVKRSLACEYDYMIWACFLIKMLLKSVVLKNVHVQYCDRDPHTSFQFNADTPAFKAHSGITEL